MGLLRRGAVTVVDLGPAARRGRGCAGVLRGRRGWLRRHEHDAGCRRCRRAAGHRVSLPGPCGKRVVHTIRTFGTWRVGVLGAEHAHYFLLELSTDADAAPERSVLVFSRAGHMVGAIFGANGRFIAQAGVFHPNGRTVRVTIPLRRLGNPVAYRWQAFAFFRGATVCRTGCLDRAPNGSVRILHDLRKPTIAFPQPARRPAEYDIGFSLSDAGGLRHRRLAAGAPAARGDRRGPPSPPGQPLGPRPTTRSLPRAPRTSSGSSRSTGTGTRPRARGQPSRSR